jgi:hypothetical protein
MGRLPQKAETHPRQINNENYQRAATAVEPTTKSSLFEVPTSDLRYQFNSRQLRSLF